MPFERLLDAHTVARADWKTAGGRPAESVQSSLPTEATPIFRRFDHQLPRPTRTDLMAGETNRPHTDATERPRFFGPRRDRLLHEIDRRGRPRLHEDDPLAMPARNGISFPHRLSGIDDHGIPRWPTNAGSP